MNVREVDQQAQDTHNDAPPADPLSDALDELEADDCIARYHRERKRRETTHE